MPPRRFPPPWTFEDHNNACFIVKDAKGANVDYVYQEATQTEQERREFYGMRNNG
jgi:hypothetical protein